MEMAPPFLLLLLFAPFFCLAENTVWHAKKSFKMKTTGAGKKGSDYQNDEYDIYEAYGSQESNDVTSKKL